MFKLNKQKLDLHYRKVNFYITQIALHSKNESTQIKIIIKIDNK